MTTDISDGKLQNIWKTYKPAAYISICILPSKGLNHDDLPLSDEPTRQIFFRLRECFCGATVGNISDKT